MNWYCTRAGTFAIQFALKSAYSRANRTINTNSLYRVRAAVHEKAFLLYGIASGLYMPFSVRLYRLCCDALPHGWTPERRATYRFKSLVCYTCMSTLFVMGVCFYGYIGFCLPVVFSIFVVLEYFMLVLNTVFHYGFLRDFPGLKMILARPVLVLNLSAVPPQTAAALNGANGHGIHPSTLPVSSSDE